MGRVAPGVGVVALFFIAENIQALFVYLCNVFTRRL